MRPVDDNFIPFIPVNHKGYRDKHPFCLNSTCHCKEDPELISHVNELRATRTPHSTRSNANR